MKKLLLPLLIGAIALTGCDRHYVVKFTNGREITTSSKPKLKGNSYHYTDPSGREMIIPQGRVKEIQPASMAREEEKKNEFKPQAPYKKHWYWPF